MRGRRAIGLPLDAAEADLQRDIARARRAVDGAIRRVEADRRRPDVPTELRREIERAKANAKPGHRYAFVPLSDVPQATRDAVADGVWRACNRLEGFPAASDVTPPLPTPVVRFFRRARDGEVANFTDARLLNGQHFWETDFVDIRVGADRTPAQCRATAVHECWHWGADDRFRHDETAAENFRGGLVLAD